LGLATKVWDILFLSDVYKGKKTINNVATAGNGDLKR